MKSIRHAIQTAAVAAVLAMGAAMTLTGCDESGYGGYGYDGYTGGYGPIDDGVFQTAADNWDAYILEKPKK